MPYLAITILAFATATRGTLLQRCLYGTAPGPGISFLLASAALVVVVLWRPGHLGSAIDPTARALIALVLVVTAWICVAMSFAAAFQADNLVENERGLDFPGEDEPG
ncbi:DUF1345 domain-containing protein [Streptomyces sp. NPDC001046]|uniref:DUF1345 domain-containing protein n=1 Tax=Streptomyces sp. NPDC001046 TaxID=3364543 RepID=UPI0036C9E318